MMLGQNSLPSGPMLPLPSREIYAYVASRGHNPSHRLRICVRDADTGEELFRELLTPAAISQPVAIAPETTPDDPEPSAVQRTIVEMLLDGAKWPKILRERLKTHLYDRKGGIQDLLDIGIVEKTGGKYALTDAGREYAEVYEITR